MPSQASAEPSASSASETVAPPPLCEDFANRQIGLADRLLQQSNYTKALKVLNSTAENCDIEMVREKIVEVLGEWYNVVRSQGASALPQFLRVVSNQAYISSAQKERFRGRAKAYVRALIEDDYRGENFEEVYQLCRSYRDYVSEHFASQYYCGTAAKELDAQGVTISSYEWLVENWDESQSIATWKDVASTLEELYFLNGRFEEAYALARQRARRDPSPESVLSSALSARGRFLAPILQASSIFYESQPSESALSYVRNDLKRINFPKYVKSFYILTADGDVEDGMYGEEANQPSMSLLKKSQGTLSLLQSTDDSNLTWLVSRLENRFLVLEFGGATTPEESVRLETVYENIESDEEWKKMYNLLFTETVPATGSAVGTFISSASIADRDLEAYNEIFDDSSLLSYYCIQNNGGRFEDSYNFDRENLGYGDTKWTETSNTRALYHHSITYSGQSVREVVWPIYIQKERNGVIRIGLIQN